jgi:hypothetical protein
MLEEDIHFIKHSENIRSGPAVSAETGQLVPYTAPKPSDRFNRGPHTAPSVGPVISKFPRLSQNVFLDFAWLFKLLACCPDTFVLSALELFSWHWLCTLGIAAFTS